MNNKDILNAVKAAKDNSEKRKFKQSIDLIIKLKDLDLKKPDQHTDFFLNLHFPHPKTRKICALVGPELLEQAKECFDNAILVDDFSSFKDKRSTKKLARSYDFFVAQANIMGKVAGTFGRAFGPLGKMPNPKGGMVVPPGANLKNVAEKLQTTMHIKVKSHLMFQATVGFEDTDEKIVVDNIKTVYDQLIHHLPQEKNNFKGMMVKLTMGKPSVVGEVAKTETNEE